MTTDLWYLALTAMLAAALWIPYIICQVRTNGPLSGENYVDPALRPVPLWGQRAHRAYLNAVEYASQSRQRELHDARVDLAHKCADTGHADDQPRVGAPAREERDRRRLRPVADEVAQAKSRRRTQILGAHRIPRPIPQWAAAIWMADPRKNQALSRGDRSEDACLGPKCRNRPASTVYLLTAFSRSRSNTPSTGRQTS